MINRKEYFILTSISFWFYFFIYGTLGAYFRETLKLPFNGLCGIFDIWHFRRTINRWDNIRYDTFFKHNKKTESVY